MNVVVIGGGTGSFTLLSRLKDHTPNITALVTMADDGGSTGVLRDELGVLPPGDVRQCLVALSNRPELRELFTYRFEDGCLKGHTMGNLFITALEKVKGDFVAGVELASHVLNITGAVEPITLTDVRLMMCDGDGKETRGEFKITDTSFSGKESRFWLTPDATANPRAVAAIENADMVVIAPGNLYSSIAPALIVPGIGDALRRSAAKKVYVCNLVTKPGQTDGYTVADFAEEIERFAGAQLLDVVIYNTQKPNKDLLQKYAREGEKAVKYDVAALNSKHYKAIGANLLSGEIWQNKAGSDPIASARTLIRHDSEKVAEVLMGILE